MSRCILSDDRSYSGVSGQNVDIHCSNMRYTVISARVNMSQGRGVVWSRYHARLRVSTSRLFKTWMIKQLYAFSGKDKPTDQFRCRYASLLLACQHNLIPSLISTSLDINLSNPISVLFEHHNSQARSRNSLQVQIIEWPLGVVLEKDFHTRNKPDRWKFRVLWYLWRDWRL